MHLGYIEILSKTKPRSKSAIN